MLFHPNKRHMSRGGCSTLHTCFVTATQSSAASHVSSSGVVLRYRPSAVQSTIFCCQANKWLVSAAVSVYWLLILSLSRGWRGAFAFSGALLSDWQSPDFIDFFLHCSLSKYPTADLKDLRHRSTSAATHGSSYNGRLLHFVLSFSFFSEGGGRDDRLCEW